MDESPKYSAFGGSASVAITKVCYTSDYLTTTGDPTPLISLLPEKNLLHWEKKGTMGRRRISKILIAGISRFPTPVTLPLMRYGNS